MENFRINDVITGLVEKFHEVTVLTSISIFLEFWGEISRNSYLPNCMEDFYCPVEVKKDVFERCAIPQGFIIMFADNIGVAQDFETIIYAVDKLKDYKDIHWIIIGDDRMCFWVEKEIEAWNLRQKFLLMGRYPPEQRPRYFALADALLVTLRNGEIFSSRYNEKCSRIWHALNQ